MVRIAVVSCVALVAAGCATSAGPATSTPSTPAAPPAAAPRLSALALDARGNQQYERKAYADCAVSFDQALAQATDARQRENFAYSAACCHALAGDKDAAFARLEQAVAAGFRDVGHLGKDPDLDALRADIRWATLVEGVQAREAAYLSTVNVELKALFDADQADRSGAIDWSQVSARDAERRAKVQQIVEAGGAKAADDWFHAAMVFQHGMTVEDLAQAHQLAARALEQDPDHGRAKWLFAASKDRWLMRQQKPQLYGTQFAKGADGKWALYPVDPAITDEERARYNVPPLKVAKQRLEQMNARPSP